MEKECLCLLKSLEKAKGDTEKEYDILCEMKRAKLSSRMTLDVLKNSSVGKLMNSYSKHPDKRISAIAGGFVDDWKKLVRTALGSSSGGSSVAASSGVVLDKVDSWSPCDFVDVGESPPPSSEHPRDTLKRRLDLISHLKLPSLSQGLGYKFDMAAKCLPGRCRKVKARSAEPMKGSPVVYWMSRDQRVCDNWAFVRAQELAEGEKAPIVVVFSLAPSQLETVRARGFMLRGLALVEKDLSALGIPFRLLLGNPSEQVSRYCTAVGASHLVTDFSPMRTAVAAVAACSASLPATCSFTEVDAHNVVPAWVASPKMEVGARTIRKKIHTALWTYAELGTGFPPPRPQVTSFPVELESNLRVCAPDSGVLPATTPTEGVCFAPRGEDGYTRWSSIVSLLSIDYCVPEVEWCRPGERAARDAGQKFLQHRLKKYEDLRNDPTQTQATSNLSPYLHFGHICAQRLVLETSRITGIKLGGLFPDGERIGGAAGFCEELVVRKELADNYCLYEPEGGGASEWAKESLNEHRGDKRDYVYPLKTFEEGRTHENLWNAMQMELVHRGKLAGWCRMYWAKKILEWSASPEEALRTALYLNDKYNLDGNDPNGIVGCMWAIYGVHDMGWKERPVFGKIRFMNLASTLKKFDTK